MITTSGSTYIKRYLAGLVPSIAQSLAFGVGGKAEASADTALQFEIGREEIDLTSYDFVNNKLIFKAALPTEMEGTIYEVGLFSQEFNTPAGLYTSRLLASFDSDTEEWVNAADGTAAPFVSPNVRIGADGLSFAPTASTTKTYQLNNSEFDLSGNSSADKLNFAYWVGSNVSGINVRFKVDASNYYSFAMTTTAGYNLLQLTKGSATITGTPNWENISTIEVAVSATSGGTAGVTFDGIRVEDTDTINPDYVMVSRELLTSPFVKTEGMIQEVEFSLDVSAA